jgi:hypothetical protein
MTTADQQQRNPRERSTYDVLTAFMVSRPELAAKLKHEHANDGTDHCRLCTTGAQSGRHIWPCQIYRAANRAAELSAP